MALIGSKKSTEEMEEELDSLKLEGEVLSEKALVEEKKAIISELKRQYGPLWKKLLGVKGLPSLSTLRSFLKSSKQGLNKWT